MSNQPKPHDTDHVLEQPRRRRTKRDDETVLALAVGNSAAARAAEMVRSLRDAAQHAAPAFVDALDAIADQLAMSVRTYRELIAKQPNGPRNARARAAMQRLYSERKTQGRCVQPGCTERRAGGHVRCLAHHAAVVAANIEKRRRVLAEYEAAAERALGVVVP
jgi:hypothetical protein